MKFGLSLMGLAPRFYGDVAATAEQHGFESVWAPEHLVLPAELPSTYLYSESGAAPIAPNSALYDPWVTLGFAAYATEKIRLATNVFILPLRHPFAVARSVLTVDRVSNGRVTLGIGVGWLAEEFDYTGQSFHDRGRRTDEIPQRALRLRSRDVRAEAATGRWDTDRGWGHLAGRAAPSRAAR